MKKVFKIILGIFMIASVVPVVALVVTQIIIPNIATDILTILTLGFTMGFTVIAVLLLFGFGIDIIDRATAQ